MGSGGVAIAALPTVICLKVSFSDGLVGETDVRVTSSSLLISSGKPEEVFPTNIFSVLNECPPIIY